MNTRPSHHILSVVLAAVLTLGIFSGVDSLAVSPEPGSLLAQTGSPAQAPARS